MGGTWYPERRRDLQNVSRGPKALARRLPPGPQNTVSWRPILLTIRKIGDRQIICCGQINIVTGSSWLFQMGWANRYLQELRSVKGSVDWVSASRRLFFRPGTRMPVFVPANPEIPACVNAA